MPNWCENILTIAGRNGVLACLEAIKGDADEYGARPIDFQKIVPMPAILIGTCDPVPEEGFVLLGDDERGQKMLANSCVREAGIDNLQDLRKYIRNRYPAAEEQCRHAKRAYQETGYWTWYEWRVGKAENRFRDGHWGTKWNACQFKLIRNSSDRGAAFHFFTAWSPPVPVIRELSRKFPALAFKLEYFEPMNEFQGTVRMKSGTTLPRRIRS